MASGYGLHGGRHSDSNPMACPALTNYSRSSQARVDASLSGKTSWHATSSTHPPRTIPARRSAPRRWRITTSVCIIRRRYGCPGPQKTNATTQWRANHGEQQQFARVQVLQSAYRKAEATAGTRENAPTATQIRSLGLLEKDAPAKN
jgi:hypothetical protein